MQDDQNGQKMMVLTSAEETRLTCFILLQNIFFWSNQPSLTADVNTIINLPWYPRKIVHFSLVLSPSRVYYDFYGVYAIRKKECLALLKIKIWMFILFQKSSVNLKTKKITVLMHNTMSQYIQLPRKRRLNKERRGAE